MASIFRTTSVFVTAVALVACAQPASPPAKSGLERIEHVVVIYAENRSFDNLYGLFPGADGIASATPEQTTQLDYDGKPLPHLPPVWKGKDADPAFPRDLPNRPFRIDGPPINLPLSVATRDLIHKFYPQQEQINGGRNNRFVEVSDAGALAMGYYDGSRLPTRVSAIIVSPFARRGYVDHTPYDTTSIAKFLTRRFSLEPLPGVRAQMGDLAGAFDFAP